MRSVAAPLVLPSNQQFVYTIRGGDNLSSLLSRFYGANSFGSPRYQAAMQHLLYFNPSIKNPNQIRAGQSLLVVPLPSEHQMAQICKAPEEYYKQQPSPPPLPATAAQSGVGTQEDSMVWALSWLEHNYNFLSMPGGAAMGSASNLLSRGNIALLDEVNRLYADYKSGKGNMSKGQYDYRRKKLLDTFKRNMGPAEGLLFGNKTTHETIRIARSGALPASTKITHEITRLNRFASLAKGGGVILTAVGAGISCRQIANAQSRHKKNEIFVESVGSISTSIVVGYGVGLFLISNPIGWGTALVLAAGTTAIGYSMGKGFNYAYNATNLKRVDLVKASHVDELCKK